MAITKTARRKRLRLGIRRKISGTADRPRISVFKSNKGIYAQIIDDSKGVTLASASTKEIGKNGVNVEVSKEVGKKNIKVILLAVNDKDKKIKKFLKRFGKIKNTKFLFYQLLNLNKIYIIFYDDLKIVKQIYTIGLNY